MHYPISKTHPASCSAYQRFGNLSRTPRSLPSGARNSEPATGNQQLAAGFTLLEILLAIFIFAIIITTIFASYRTVFSGTDAINKDQAYYEMAKGCLNRMVIDLQSIYIALPPAYTIPDFDDSPDSFRIVSDTDFIKGLSFARLRFTSLAHLPLGKNQHDGIAEIVYYVEETGENQLVLKRSDSLNLLQSAQKKTTDPVLCKGLKKLEYTFYDQEGTEYETWNSELKEFDYTTPRAIGIKLELNTGSDTGLLFETRVNLPAQRTTIK